MLEAASARHATHAQLKYVSLDRVDLAFVSNGAARNTAG